MRGKIITSLTMRANWYELLQEAKSTSGYSLREELEHYLILTLNNFQPDSYDFSGNIATDFLIASNTPSAAAYSKLRKVGDHCLLINGIFPAISSKRNVSLNYYAVMGRQAYENLATRKTKSCHDIDKKLFHDLSVHFVGLSDLMHTMLQLPR